MTSPIALPPISPSQVEQYQSKGFLILRSLLDEPEVKALQKAADQLLLRTDLMHSDNIRCRWANHQEAGECRFDCFDPVIDLSEVCAQIARHPQILGSVSTLYGEPAHLFKDKLIFKPPGAKGYALHQDYISWKSFPRSFMTVIVAIDPASAENGATEVFPGLHTQGCLSKEDGEYHELPEAIIRDKTGVYLDLAPGDVAFFSGFTPHRSGPNLSAHARRLLYLSYNAESDGGEQREQHYGEFRKWLHEKYAEYGKVNTFFR